MTRIKIEKLFRESIFFSLKAFSCFFPSTIIENNIGILNYI